MRVPIQRERYLKTFPSTLQTWTPSSWITKSPRPRNLRLGKQTALKPAARLQEALSICAWGHYCYFTGNGYMGLGPPLTQKGDILCILQDAKVPFILRPHEEGYHLVGEAFAFGLVDGDDVARAGYADKFEEIILY